MSKIFLGILFAAITVSAAGIARSKSTLRVAVIDTGVRKDIFVDKKKNGICKKGHKDLTGKGLYDTNGHGTNVSGLINRYARGIKYCQVIIKYYQENVPGSLNLLRLKQGLKYAIEQKVDMINISGGGPTPNLEEKLLIKKALDQGIEIVAAAGNDKINLDKDCNYYPACYDRRIHVVGVIPKVKGNYGEVVDFYEEGFVRIAHGIMLSGSSQATASYTGKLVQKLGTPWK